MSISHVNVKERLKFSAWTGSQYSHKWICNITNNITAIYHILLLIVPNYSQQSLLLSHLCNKITQPNLKNTVAVWQVYRKYWVHTWKNALQSDLEKNAVKILIREENNKPYVCLCMCVRGPSICEAGVDLNRLTETKMNTHEPQHHTDQHSSCVPRLFK